MHSCLCFYHCLCLCQTSSNASYPTFKFLGLKVVWSVVFWNPSHSILKQAPFGEYFLILLISQATFSNNIRVKSHFVQFDEFKYSWSLFYDCCQSREEKLTLPSSITTWPASSRAWKRQIHIRKSLGPQKNDKFIRKMQGLKMANSH